MPGHTGSQQDPPISDSAARQIASAFKLPVSEIFLDARQVETWGGPADDLLVSLEHRHAFRARHTVSYLVSLRKALQGNSTKDDAG